MNYRMRIRWGVSFIFLTLGALFLLAYGCGGGGSGGGAGDGGSLIKQGVFVDGPVEGLEYKTATQSGFTDVNGTYGYQEQEIEHHQEIIVVGELITFSVGDIVVGHGIAKAQMTPVDLVDAAQDQNNPEVNPTVTNISRLLVSLDVDGNPDNGITISQQIRDACRGISIDFTKSVADFEADPDVVSLFATLNDMGVFPEETERRLCPVLRSRTHLRESLRGIRSRPVKNWEWIDSNNDGQFDEVVKYTYDAYGNLIKERRDDSDDGTVDYAVDYTYDASGNRIMETIDSSNDGEIDSVHNYTYDDNGNMTKAALDLDNDGEIDFIANRIYRADGNLVKEEIDLSADGTIDSVIKYTYDSNGYLTREEHDFSNDGETDAVIYYTYDDNCYRIREEQDWDMDGNIDYFVYFTYDENGMRIKEQQDSDADGKIDYFTNYSYDTSRVIEERDSDADGKIDWVVEHYYTDDYGAEDEAGCSGPDMIGPEGGIMEITDPGSALYGVKVQIPKDTLLSCRTLYIEDTYVGTTPALPAGFESPCRGGCVFDIETSGSQPVSMPMQISIPTSDFSVGSGEVLCAFYYDDAKEKWQLSLPQEGNSGIMTINTTYKEHWSWGKVVLDEVDDMETLEHLLEHELGNNNWSVFAATIQDRVNTITQDFEPECSNLDALLNTLVEWKYAAKENLERFNYDLGDTCGSCDLLAEDFLVDFWVDYVQPRMEIWITENIFYDVPTSLEELAFQIHYRIAVLMLWDQIHSAPCDYQCLIDNSTGIWDDFASYYLANIGIVLAVEGKGQLECN